MIIAATVTAAKMNTMKQRNEAHLFPNFLSTVLISPSPATSREPNTRVSAVAANKNP